MSRHEHGSGSLLRSGPPEGLGDDFSFPSAEGALNSSLGQRPRNEITHPPSAEGALYSSLGHRPRNVQRNVPDLGEVA